MPRVMNFVSFMGGRAFVQHTFMPRFPKHVGAADHLVVDARDVHLIEILKAVNRKAGDGERTLVGVNLDVPDFALGSQALCRAR